MAQSLFDDKQQGFCKCHIYWGILSPKLSQPPSSLLKREFVSLCYRRRSLRIINVERTYWCSTSLFMSSSNINVFCFSITKLPWSGKKRKEKNKNWEDREREEEKEAEMKAEMWRRRRDHHHRKGKALRNGNFVCVIKEKWDEADLSKIREWAKQRRKKKRKEGGRTVSRWGFVRLITVFTESIRWRLRSCSKDYISKNL